MKCPHCGKETEKPALSDHEQALAVCLATFERDYPKRLGGQRWPEARRNFVRLAKRMENAWDLVRSAKEYGKYCEQQGILGTPYVMQAATFLGQGGGWEEDWSTLYMEVFMQNMGVFEKARRQLQEQA